MAYAKPDASLLKTPVDSLCGSPDKRDYSGSASGDVYGLKAPEGVSAELGATPVLLYDDIKPGGADKPSDSKKFQGVSEV